MAARLVGFAGIKRSGKNTAMNWLYARFGGSQYAFADEVKVQAQRLLFDVCDVQVDPWTDKSDAMRGVLQALGTDVVRAYDPDAWVRFLMRQVDIKIRYASASVVPAYLYFSDVRFPNEAQAIRDRGGYVVWVGCDEAVLAERVQRLDGPQQAARAHHSSENSLTKADCDFAVDSTTRFTLNRDMSSLLQRLRHRWAQTVVASA